LPHIWQVNLADLELSLVEKRKAVDRRIQENHLVELVMSNRQMVIFGFFSLVKSDSVKTKATVQTDNFS
jgi:hypothetical protein